MAIVNVVASLDYLFNILVYFDEVKVFLLTWLFSTKESNGRFKENNKQKVIENIAV